MDLDHLWNWIFGGFTVVGFFFSFYFGLKSIRLEKQKKSLNFQEMLLSANELKSRLTADDFVPEIIFTPGLRGATFANLLEDEFTTNTRPVIVGITFFEKDGLNFFGQPEGYEVIETERWQLFIPKLLFTQKDKKMLIVDDFALTGDFLQILKKQLAERGFIKDRIRTATIATTTVAIISKNGPDYYWYTAHDDAFFFPWGRAK